MHWTTAFQLASAIVLSLGGGGAIVIGLSSFLGKLWAERALQKEKHKYADMLQNAASELENAKSRYQIELDALAHIHRLRTDEEFSRLGQFWKHMAILQNAQRGAVSMGVKLEPADKELREKYRADRREEYERALYEARKFFYEEKLFIPDLIAKAGESTLMHLIKEKNYYDLKLGEGDREWNRIYLENLPELVGGFEQAPIFGHRLRWH